MASKIQKHRKRWTHFLSVPIKTDEIEENYNIFKEEIFRDYGTGRNSITEQMFQKFEKFHLTVKMLLLEDVFSQIEAIKALEFCEENFIKYFSFIFCHEYLV